MYTFPLCFSKQSQTASSLFHWLLLLFFLIKLCPEVITFVLCEDVILQEVSQKHCYIRGHVSEKPSGLSRILCTKCMIKCLMWTLYLHPSAYCISTQWSILRFYLYWSNMNPSLHEAQIESQFFKNGSLYDKLTSSPSSSSWMMYEQD